MAKLLGLQEMAQVMEKDTNKELAKHVKTMVDDRGYFDFSEWNLYGKGFEQKERGYTPLKKADAFALQESIHGIPLREFLGRSGSTGISGAAYLIPTKIYDVIYTSAVEEDFTAWLSIGGNIIPAEQIPGNTMKVDVTVDGQYKPHKYASGGSMSAETIETVQAELDFSTPWGINFPITNDLIEDSQFDLIELHLKEAGREMGEFATNEALTILKTATDGDGTVNGGASGDADETKFTGATTTDLVDLHKAILIDGYKPNKMVLTPEAFYHSIATTVYVSSATYSEPWAYNLITEGLPNKLLGCEIHWTIVDTITNDQAMTDCVSIMFDDRFALLTGRKRWLKIENYSEPVRDLVGATVSARQDSVTVYDDSIGVVTET